MAAYNNHEDVLLSGDPHFSTPYTSPSQQSKNTQRSARSSSDFGHVEDDDATDGRYSLAHELAVALMPEPSSGSRLAEELGIEYDEGAEGIDDDNAHDSLLTSDSYNNRVGPPNMNLSEALNDPPSNARDNYVEKDPMIILAEDLESTDQFISHLKRLDTDSSVSSPYHPELERIASNVILRINEAARDREGQVRELIGYEREFRKIAGEVGGNDVLGHLDELIHIDDLSDSGRPADIPDMRTSASVEGSHSQTSRLHEWDVDVDSRPTYNDYDSGVSPLKASFSTLSLDGLPTTALMISHLSGLRSFTSSLVSTLTTVSDHAQVNGAATTDAGRKIRAVKNKLTGWRAELDSTELSKMKIEKWEAGTAGAEALNGSSTPISSWSSRRLDCRTVVAEHLHAFELALTEAARKTQVIMAG